MGACRPGNGQSCREQQHTGCAIAAGASGKQVDARGGCHSARHCAQQRRGIDRGGRGEHWRGAAAAAAAAAVPGAGGQRSSHWADRDASEEHWRQLHHSPHSGCEHSWGSSQLALRSHSVGEAPWDLHPGRGLCTGGEQQAHSARQQPWGGLAHCCPGGAEEGSGGQGEVHWPSAPGGGWEGKQAQPLGCSQGGRGCQGLCRQCNGDEGAAIGWPRGRAGWGELGGRAEGERGQGGLGVGSCTAAAAAAAAHRDSEGSASCRGAIHAPQSELQLHSSLSYHLPWQGRAGAGSMRVIHCAGCRHCCALQPALQSSPRHPQQPPTSGNEQRRAPLGSQASSWAHRQQLRCRQHCERVEGGRQGGSCCC